MKFSQLVTFVILFSSMSALAQTDANNVQNHVIIKFSPLTLFDRDNTVQFGAEVPLGKSDFSIQQDLGNGTSGFSIWYYEDRDRPDKTTFKSRTHLRYYYYERTRMRAYVAGEFMYKRVMYRKTDWVGMDCQYGMCDYLQEMPVRTERRALAFHPRMGWQFYFPHRLTLDLFVGVGLRQVRTSNRGISNGSYYQPDLDDWFYTSPGTDVIPSVALGFHLGMALGKFKH